MKSLLATACTLSLLLAAADPAQAGQRDGFTGLTRRVTVVRDHRQQPVVRDHRVIQEAVVRDHRVTSSVTPTRQVNSSVNPFRQVERAVRAGTKYCVGPFCYHR